MRPVNRKWSVNRKLSVTHKRLGTRKRLGKYKLSGGDLQMTEVITSAELRDYITRVPKDWGLGTQLEPFMNMDHENEKVIWTLNDTTYSYLMYDNILLTNYGKILYVKMKSKPYWETNGMVDSWKPSAQIVKNNYWIQTEDLPPIKILLKDIQGHHHSLIGGPHQNRNIPALQYNYHDRDCIFENLSAYLTYLKNKSLTLKP